MRRFDFKDLGILSYEDTYALQIQLLEERIVGKGRDTVLLLEHTPVYTLGRRGKVEHIRGGYDANAEKIADAEVIRIDRGGDITFHGPGQLVIYPVIALHVREQKLRRLLRCYEELIIHPLKMMGVDAFRVEGKTGVWTHAGKVASIGIGIRRWVTYHGIALNVSTDLTYFDRILPCGLQDCKMVNLNSLSGEPISIAEMKTKLVEIFEDVWKEFPF